MPTFLLLLVVLAGRFVMALVRGTAYLVLLPARTALALAPNSRNPRPWMVSGVVASAALMLGAVLLAMGAVR